MPTNAKQLPYSKKTAKAWANEHIRGFYEAPITPLTPDFEIDEKAIHQIADTYADWGIPAVTIGGNVSEGWNMTGSQWKQLHETWADAADGRMDLWTIILDPAVSVCLEKMDLVQRLGFVGAEVMNPVSYLVTDDEIYSYFEYLVTHSDLAIWLYRTPVAKALMSLELVKRLAELDTIVGVKEGSLIVGDAERLQTMCRPDFIVSWPVERYYLDHLKHGGQVMWATFFYTVYGKRRDALREYIDLAGRGEWDRAAEISKQLDPARDLIDKVIGNRVAKIGSYATSVARIKAWFEAVGLPGGPVLPPLKQLDARERERLEESFAHAGIV